MLPVHRLIGHKEYAKGRKSDPRYSMDWRRRRVAAFRPRNEPATSPAPALRLSLEDDMLLVSITSDDGKDYKGHWLQDSVGYHNAASADVVKQLRARGCPEIGITESTHKQWVQAQDRLRGLPTS